MHDSNKQWHRPKHTVGNKQVSRTRFFFANLFLLMCVCQSLEQLDLEETKKDLINREIRSFRDAHKVNIS